MQAACHMVSFPYVQNSAIVICHVQNMPVLSTTKWVWGPPEEVKIAEQRFSEGHHIVCPKGNGMLHIHKHVFCMEFH